MPSCGHKVDYALADRLILAVCFHTDKSSVKILHMSELPLLNCVGLLNYVVLSVYFDMKSNESKQAFKADETPEE